jgi:predicted acylesterase/phospholipase RssA
MFRENAMRGELTAYTWHALRGTQEDVIETVKNKNNSQRALVFQGGGALGAYEAGTFQQIYKKVNQENENGKLFDIIAGTSIGAINSTVLVGHYLENNNS